MSLHHGGAPKAVVGDQVAVPQPMTAPARNRWRRDLGLRLLSVLLALLLWLYIQGAHTVDREIDLPIRYVGLQDSLQLLEPVPRSVRAVLSGPVQAMLLRPLLLSHAAVRVDLSRARPPRHSVSLALRDVEVPAHTRLTMVRFVDSAPLELRLGSRSRPRAAVVTGRRWRSARSSAPQRALPPSASAG
jgi:hypothetical protein